MTQPSSLTAPSPAGAPPVESPSGFLLPVILRPFEEAVAAYLATPNPLTLLALNKRAIPLMEAIPRTRPWRLVSEQSETSEPPLGCDFSAIRVICDRKLDGAEVNRLSGCLAYALKATLATGDDALPEPHVEFAQTPEDSPVCLTFTLLEYAFDASRSIRTDPDPVAAFTLARQYIREGTPMRTTDREGAGTRNTRLLEGIGNGIRGDNGNGIGTSPCNLTFYVR